MLCRMESPLGRTDHRNNNCVCVCVKITDQHLHNQFQYDEFIVKQLGKEGQL